MFARILSTLLIPALIACPVVCSEGVCDVTCCSARQPLQACSPVDGTTPHCCQQSQPVNHSPGPQRPSGKAPCHGVCGGAIFEKPVEFNEVVDPFFCALVDIDVGLVLQLTQRQFHCVEHHWYCHGGNHGRSLRTLQMSLLC